MLLQYEQQLDDLSERLVELQGRRLDDCENRLSTARARLLAARPDKVVAALRDRLNSAGRMLAERAGNVLALRGAALAELAAKLDSLSPSAVLAYRAGKILKDSTAAKAGDRVDIKLYKGSLVCAVEKVED